VKSGARIEVAATGGREAERIAYDQATLHS